MNKFVYTVSIDGMNVKHGRATLYVIKHISDLDKARSMIKNTTLSNLKNHHHVL